MDRECSTDWTEEKCLKILNGKAKGRDTTERQRRRSEDNIKMDLRELDPCDFGYLKQ
jgi:hypothetical protein